MELVTYYLGAGASSGIYDLTGTDVATRAIPFGGYLGPALEEYSNTLSRMAQDESSAARLPFDVRSTIRSLHESLGPIISGLQQTTIDTFVKRTFLTTRDSEKLRGHKIALACAFKYWEYIRPRDKRYIDFITSVTPVGLAREVALPANLRVVTWNYDLQFEDSIRDIYGMTVDEELVSQTCPTTIDRMAKFNKEKFSLFHLNGTCDKHIKRGKDNSPEFLREAAVNRMQFTHDDVVKNTLEIAAAFEKRPDLEPSISYAWEPSPLYQTFQRELLESIASTVAVVAIGYSFPFYNRAVDREILGSMTKLKKVYLQVPETDQKEFRNRILATVGREIDIVEISDMRQFHIPYEFK